MGAHKHVKTKRKQKIAKPAQPVDVCEPKKLVEKPQLQPLTESATRAIRLIQEKASPAPWRPVLHNDPRGQPSPMYRSLVATVEHNGERYLAVVQEQEREVPREEWEANTQFIAYARAWVPGLLEVVELARDFVRAGEGEDGLRAAYAYERLADALGETGVPSR